MINPTRSSLKKTWRIVEKSMRPVAKPRTTMVADWPPTLPPMPVMTGMNEISAMTSLRVTLNSHIR